MPPCPCGAQRRSGQDVIDYLDQAALDALVPALEVGNWAPLLSWLLGTPVNVDTLCAAPPGSIPELTQGFFEDPLTYLTDLLAIVNAVRWPLLCECTPCPVVTDCDEGTSYTLESSDGYFEAGSCYAYKFHLVDADVFLRAEGCSCAGAFHGDVYIQWSPPQNLLIPNPNYPASGPEFIGGCGGVTEWLLEFTGSGAGETAVCNTHGSPGTATVWQNGGGSEPSYPWPELPTTVEPLPDPPACTEGSQCDALDYLGRTVTELIWQTAVIAQRTANVETDVADINGPYAISLPGLTDPITGTLAEVLPRLFAALAPPTETQMTQEWTEPASGAGVLDVIGIAMVEVVVTTLPPGYATFGVQQPVYYTGRGSRAPGYVTLRTAFGSVGKVMLDFQGSNVILIPPLVTALTYDLDPGVEVDVTGHSRSV